jgi:hypothetical protein
MGGAGHRSITAHPFHVVNEVATRLLQYLINHACEIHAWVEPMQA